MTTTEPTEFTVTARREHAVLLVRVGGELDYDTSDELVDEVVRQLTTGPTPPAEVRLDFGALTWIDSSGLSALLMIHRRTSALGAVLHLDDRPEILERLLQVTNVLGHLTAPVADAERGRPEAGDGTSVARAADTRTSDTRAADART
ncbi:STAS domain-containing protein [Streptomyces griseofuscus]|uniref:STAS domain-containing protein n=1 Tax=Streptomyces TaxID=1883 RepID=UPI0018F07BAD|nr:STAS domain-containing protein [Streptomyces sp. CRPSP2-6A1]MBJ7002705.1 STAS domain-containing protein [Streptomyces sp. CRPSP2-6A1]